MKAPRVDVVPESDRAPGAAHPRATTALFGHGAAERTLLDSFRSGRFPHAWILGGRPGIGKATLAWRLARFLLAHPDPTSPAVRGATSLFVPPDAPEARKVAALAVPDFVLLRREWNSDARPPKHFTEIRVDDVRAASGRFRLSASDGGWRVAVIDVADDLNRSAANAILKLIEEPPPRSLFLLAAHQPGRLLPTIRSRCRRLLLTPLSREDLAAALAAQGVEPSAPGYAAALARAGGSVGEALRLLGQQGSRLAGDVERLLRALPHVDWREATALAERVGPIRAQADFETFADLVMRHLDAQVRARAGQGAHALAPYAQVWEKFGQAARTADALNLDKRPLVLSLFEDLAGVAR